MQKHIPTCRHTLCDLCYIKLSACPFCRSPYLFYKKTKAEYKASNKLLDKILLDCSKENRNPDTILNNFGLLNRIFNRWIFYCKSCDDEDNEREWIKRSIDREFLNHIDNYRRITDYPEERDMLRAKSTIALDMLVRRLRENWWYNDTQWTYSSAMTQNSAVLEDMGTVITWTFTYLVIFAQQDEKILRI